MSRRFWGSMDVITFNTKKNPPPFSDSSISYQFWGDEKFRSSHHEWDELVQNSPVDPLFLSWSWLFGWWSLRHESSDVLFIIAVYKDSELIALAPLYKRKVNYLRGLFKGDRLTFLGKGFSDRGGLRTEYMDFIIRKGYQGFGLNALLDVISKDLDWTEFLLSDFDANSPNFASMCKWKKINDLYSKVDGSGYSYLIDCNKNYEEYLSSLGKFSRLKLFNRRSRLQALGKVELRSLTEESLDEAFRSLNIWHKIRWGKLTFTKKNQEFIKDYFSSTNQSADLNRSSIMTLNGEPISIMLNLFINGTIYNIQCGYIEKFDKKLALGFLHIGYCLEQAFSDPEVNTFDLLEGRGKYSNYKQHIAKKARLLTSERWLRQTRVKLLFAIYERYFSYLTNKIRRWFAR